MSVLRDVPYGLFYSVCAWVFGLFPVFCSNTALLFFPMSLWDRFLEVGFLSQRINACGISGGIANSPS